MESVIIRELCRQLEDEAKAIRDYTDSIAVIEDEKVKEIFTEIRGDELGHAQKLIVALTEVMGGNEPDAAESME